MDNNPRFPSTSWTLVSKVRCDDSALVADALAIIYQRYRYPLCCCKNLDHPDAEDVLQDFFTRFIRRRSLEQAERARGGSGDSSSPRWGTTCGIGWTGIPPPGTPRQPRSRISPAGRKRTIS